MKDSMFGRVRLLLALAFLFIGPAEATDSRSATKKPPKADAGSLWMKGKLEHSKNLLAALTKADFEAIKEAGKLQTIKYLVAADHGKKPDYRRQLGYFEDANKELIRQAGKKNINGATLAYTQLTLSCVQCHNVIRDVKKK